MSLCAPLFAGQVLKNILICMLNLFFSVWVFKSHGGM